MFCLEPKVMSSNPNPPREKVGNKINAQKKLKIKTGKISEMPEQKKTIKNLFK